MANTDFILEIKGPDLEGESTQAGFEKKIDIMSWSWGESNLGTHGTGGGGGKGKVSMSDMTLSMEMSKASPALMLACATGAHYDEVILHCRKAGGDEPVLYLKITMKEVNVTSYQTGGSNGGGLPIDSFSLNFASINHEYVEQTAKGGKSGTTSKGFSIATGKAL